MNHIIDATFSSVEQFERFDRYTTLQSLYTALDHQVEDGLMRQQELDRMRFIVGKLWDLKLQIHILEKECATDVGLVPGGYNSKVTVCLRVYAFEMQQLRAKGVIRNFSMRKRRATIKPITGIIFECDVYGGFMFSAKRYMSMNDAYFTPSTIRFPYEMKTLFDRILHELQCLVSEHPHFTMDLDQLDRIFENRLFRVEATPFP